MVLARGRRKKTRGKTENGRPAKLWSSRTNKRNMNSGLLVYYSPQNYVIFGFLYTPLHADGMKPAAGDGALRGEGKYFIHSCICTKNCWSFHKNNKHKLFIRKEIKSQENISALAHEKKREEERREENWREEKRKEEGNWKNKNTVCVCKRKRYRMDIYRTRITLPKGIRKKKEKNIYSKRSIRTKINKRVY